MSTQQEDEIHALRAQLADVQTRLQHIALADHPAEAALDYLQELRTASHTPLQGEEGQTQR